MIRVRWPDGRITEAASWPELTGQVASLPWNREHADIRNELAHRAYVLTGEIVDPSLPDRELWLELARVGLAELGIPNDLPAW